MKLLPIFVTVPIIAGVRSLTNAGGSPVLLKTIAVTGTAATTSTVESPPTALTPLSENINQKSQLGIDLKQLGPIR